MIGIHDDLARRAESGRPIRFAILGAGQMGVDMTAQVQQMKGLEVSAVADIDLSRAIQAYEIAGVPSAMVARVASVSDANDAIRAGKFVVTDRPEIVPAIEAVESMVDATGHPEAGAHIALDAFAHGKHVVMMNVEGGYHNRPGSAAPRGAAGVLYTAGAGMNPLR